MSIDRSPGLPLDMQLSRRRLFGLGVAVSAAALAGCDANPSTQPTQRADHETTPGTTYERAANGAEMVHRELGAMTKLAGDIVRRDQLYIEAEDGRYFLYNRLRDLSDEAVRSASPVPTVMLAYNSANRELTLNVYESVRRSDAGWRIENYFDLTAMLAPDNGIERAGELNLGILETLSAELVPADGPIAITTLTGGCGQDSRKGLPDSSPDPTRVRGMQFSIEPQRGVYTISVSEGDDAIANHYAPEDGEYTAVVNAAQEAMQNARDALGKF